MDDQETYIESGEDALSEWSQALQNGKGKDYLSSLNVRALEDDDVVLLLSNLILTMYDSGVYDDGLLDDLLDTFQLIRPAFSRATPMEIVIVTLPLIDPSAVSWVWMRKGVDIRSIILNLSEWLDNGQVDLVMASVVRIFNREDPNEIYDMLNNPSKEGSLASLLDNKTIAFLMNEAEKKGNDGMWNYLREAYAINAPLVGPPPWMMSETPVVLLPLPKAYITGEPLSDDTLDLLKSTIPPNSFDLAASIIRCDVGIVDSTTKRTKYGLSDDRFSSFEEERELFRIYGPSNTFFDNGEDENPPGSDRMFTCDLYDYDEDFETPTPIYTGECDWKGHKISDERCAVRRPVSGGGWAGSYCSTLCIREQLEDSRGTDSILDVDGVLSMVDTMEQQLIEWGVYSSIPRN